MNEHPVDPVHRIEEHPVLDSNLFLLRYSNKAFIERRNDHPTLGLPLTNREKAFVGAFAVCLLFTVLIQTILSPFLASIMALGLIGGFLGLIAKFGYLPNDTFDLAGWIVPGVVLHSEKIRIREGNYRSQRLGIRYQFTAPGGVVIEGYAEGEQEGASDKMAPALGTPVRVWYDDEGNHYLL